jgi:hypothetical protein
MVRDLIGEPYSEAIRTCAVSWRMISNRIRLALNADPADRQLSPLLICVGCGLDRLLYRESLKVGSKLNGRMVEEEKQASLANQSIKILVEPRDIEKLAV